MAVTASTTIKRRSRVHQTKETPMAAVLMAGNALCSSFYPNACGNIERDAMLMGYVNVWLNKDTDL